jgi:PAS domain-containing protein
MSFEPGAEEGWAGRALAQFPDALCVVDPRGEVLWAGGAVESVTGGPPESIVGQKIERPKRPGAVAGTSLRARPAAETGRTRPASLPVAHTP